MEVISKSAGLSKKSTFTWSLLIVIALLAGAGAVFALNIPGMGKYQKINAVNGVVTIPVVKVADGAAHFYKFADGGKDIGFFVVKAADGSLRVAFDTCDVCFKEKKGYVQQGDFMVCKNCNQRFASNRIGPHAVGGCNPSYLASATFGNNVVINAVDLQAGAKYF
jgi:uncharacterized membrane protein